MLQKMVMEYLFNEENKQKVIDELNKNVNVPIINEDTEEKIISAIYEVFEDVMGKGLKKECLDLAKEVNLDLIRVISV